MVISLDRTSAGNSTVKSIGRVLESWAPKALAESYDNPGLQVGRPDSRVKKGLIALDMTPQVLQEAIENGCELIVTHHPLIFSPLSDLTPHSYVSGLALALAESKIALYSSHTNLDSARGGVSFALAEQLGLIDVDFLMHKDDCVVKLITFAPFESANQVREAMTAAGAGTIGQYSGCAFETTGKGYFTPGSDTNPSIGDPGGASQSVDEIRIESEVTKWDLPAVLTALHASHPYDEVPYDVYPVKQAFRNAGLGAIGELEIPVSLRQFLVSISSNLKNPALRYAGDLDKMIKRVAVCGGSGSKYLSLAQRAGADAYVTADVSYHTFFDSLHVDGRHGIALIDPGHYESERITEQLLLDYLQEKAPDVLWKRTSTRTAPVRTFVS
jgi:dinuclear metal center YbgI/SA1388 family protein